MEKPIIFISHINEERDIAIAVKEFIDKKFLNIANVFLSSHEESLKLGDEWFITIKTSLKNCKIIIILCSPLSINKPWINFEAGAGWIKDIPVIPLCHSGLSIEKLPFPLKSFQGGILNNKEDIKKLFNVIAKILDIKTPKINKKEFFDKISLFENKIINSSLIQDINFISSLLKQQTELLKYYILASTLDYKDLDSFEIEKNFIEYSFNFKDIHNLFNVTLLMLSYKKVFEGFYFVIHECADNIKFILSNNFFVYTTKY